MAKIMEANATETIFDQKLGKSFSDVIGPNNITDFIYTQIAKVLFFIASPTQSPVGLLLTFNLQKPVADLRNERQSTETGFCLCPICLD